MAKLKKKFKLDDVIGSIRDDITEAVNFITEEFGEDFEKGDRYFNGEVDIEVDDGRSAVVATVVRDSIRNLRPSVMRVLTSNRRRMVKYIPSNLQVAAVVEQQEIYVHSLFWKNGGYDLLYSATDESFKHRYGPVKTYWEDGPQPEYVRFTGMPLDDVQVLSEMPDVEILSITAQEAEDDQDVATFGGVDENELYTVEVEQSPANGRIVLEAIPYGEFFISRNARSVKGARVHGHRRSVTVGEAIEMGLDYDGDWFDFDNLDPEAESVSGQAIERRGYSVHPEDERGDVLSHRFLLTEAYVNMDLEGRGYNQCYCLYLAGTSYEVLDHYRESESPFDIIRHDPRAFTVVGSSISDLTVQNQDVATSLLRSMVDNTHLVNNPRIAGNPTNVNFDDLLQHDMGHPIRTRGNGNQLQVIEIASQLQSTLPFLAYLDQAVQNTVGVTKAAQGLDPGAMQSTDKQAVQNTIQMAQGQTELAVRNIIETGLIGIFQKLLRLSVQHLDKIQIIKMRGMILPVNQLYFDPDMLAQAEVGLGTVSEQERRAGLMFVQQQQEKIMTTIGVDNPMVSMSQIYNTIEDITESFGLYDVSRYFSMVTPDVEKAFAEKRAQQQKEAQAQQEKGGMDPAQALLQVEGMKQQTNKLKLIAGAKSDNMKLALDAIKFNADDDFRRDELAQKRQLESAKILATTAVSVDQNEITREQNASRPDVTSGGGTSEPAESEM